MGVFWETRLTLDRAESPAFVFAVVVGGGTPEMSVLPPHTRAAVEPLAIVQEGQVAGSAVRVALNSVDLYRGEKDFSFQRALVHVLNFSRNGYEWSHFLFY